MSMGDFYAIAEEFGTPCQPGDDLSEAVARVLTEVMRRLMDDDAPEREWVTGPPLVAADLAPPEPALRVGDWVRCTHPGKTRGQIVSIDGDWHSVQSDDVRWGASGPEILTRIEPPVGWPVAVPDRDAPGGVRWWVRDPGGEYRGHHDGKVGYLEWPDLVAANGVPALAPEPTP